MFTNGIYIVADLEGCIGVTGPDPVYHSHSYQRVKIKKKWAMQCTRELNSMIKGLQIAGAERFLLVEGHPGCFLPELIKNRNAEIVKVGDGGLYLPRSDEKWDGVCLLGHHVKEGTKNGFLAHTMSMRNPQKWYINQKEAGEVGIIQSWMAEIGVPLLHVTGGNRLQEEVRALNADIIFTTTKIEHGFLKAVDLPVEQVLAQIESDAAQALSKNQPCQPIIQKHSRVFRKFVVRNPLQAFKAISYIILVWAKSKGEIEPKGLFGLEVKAKNIRTAINMLLGFPGKTGSSNTITNFARE